VSIVATQWAGWGTSMTVLKDQFVVSVGEPVSEYRVPRRPDRLVILLPDGKVGTFKIRPGTAKQFEFWSCSKSLLKGAVTACAETREADEIAAFLRGYDEPNRSNP